MSQPKIKIKKEPMEQQSQQQLSPEALKEAMDRYEKQKAQEREQQDYSEMKVWQLNIFRQRSEFWQKIYTGQLCTVDHTSRIGAEKQNLITPLDAAKLAASQADAAIEQWDERFLPKPSQPPQQEENPPNAQPN